MINDEVYSAIMDRGTCDSCADWDGRKASEGYMLVAPNPDCSGGGRCRCITFFIVDEDVDPSEVDEAFNEVFGDLE